MKISNLSGLLGGEECEVRITQVVPKVKLLRFCR